MNFRRATLIVFALGGLILWGTGTMNDSKIPDPRYAAVAGDQIKHSIDFLLTPADMIKDNPAIVKDVLLPAMGLVSYHDSGD